MSWKLKVDVTEEFSAFGDEEATFKTTRDLIVAKLEALDLSEFNEQDVEQLDEIVEALRYSPDLDEFDDHWEELYDWADDNRLWIEVF